MDCAGETIVHNKVAYTCALVTGRDPRVGIASGRARKETRTGELEEKRHRQNARGLRWRHERGWPAMGGRGGLTVAEPSLLNVNVRHLLLRLYDPLLFVCICGTGAARWRSRRRKGRIEKAAKEQAPPTRRSAIRCGFCPCFRCMSLFLFWPPLYPFPLRADALRKPPLGHTLICKIL